MKTPEEIAKIQISEKFIDGMKNRMIVSYFKYGDIRDCFPHKTNALATAIDRIKTYEKTKNTEFLIDASNFLMIEFILPSIEGAFFRATDSHESPGTIDVEGKRKKIN